MDQNEFNNNMENTIEVIPRRFFQNLMEKAAYYIIGTNFTTYIEAINSQNSQKWLKAMKLKLNTLENQGTWTLVKSPKDRKILKGK